MNVKRIAFATYVAVIGVLVTATVLEKIYGTPFVMEHIYGAWWFIALWGILCVGSVVTLIRGKVYKRPATLLLHLSFILILIGALVTHLDGLQGSMHLRKGEVANMMMNRETELIEQLPFQLKLVDFDLQTYPGTQSPMDYRSVVVIDGTTDTLAISMNNIGEYQSYRFYQSGYDPDLQGTYLSVSHDPWGIGITYTGYFLLILSMIWIIIKPLLPSLHKGRGLGWGLFFLSLPSFAAPKTLPADVASEFGNLYTYYNGRICPFQTMAIDFTTKLYGSPTYKGLSAEQVVTGWMLFPTSWTDQPFIKIKGKALHELLQTDENYVSYDDFFYLGSYRLDDVLAQMHSGVEVPEARAINEADEKMNLLLMLWNGQLLKLYPVQTFNSQLSTVIFQWYSQMDNLPDSMPHDQWFFIKHSMDYVGELAVQHDYQELTTTLQKIRQYQQKTMGDNLPSDFQFKAEKLYNSLNYIKLLAIFLLTIGIIAYVLQLFGSPLRLPFKGSEKIQVRPLREGFRKGFSFFICIIIIVGFIYLLLFFTLRTIVSSHIPLANGFEVMVFMSACSLLFAIVRPTQRSYGLIVAGLTLLVAMMGQSNPQITPLMPVLSSPLLSIHVCLVMLSYTLFAFLALQSLAALIAGRNCQLSIVNYQLKTAVFLLAAGIILGAIWANQSWGRYWGWDPKEVWALITLMVYAIPLHFSTPPRGSGERGWHLYMIFAFLTVIITYFGVNFFLGGMHSYANG